MPRSSTSPRRTMTIEVTGSADKIEAFERMIRPHGLVEMVRTGEIAIARGQTTTAPESPRRPRAPIALLFELASCGRWLVERRRRQRSADACQHHRRGRRLPIPARRSSPRDWPRTAGSAGSSPIAGFALAALGVAHEATSRGRERASTTSPRECLRRRDASSTSRRGCRPAPGPVWLGGFAFDPEGGGARPGPRLRAGLAGPAASSRSAAAGRAPSSPSTPSSGPATTRRRRAPRWRRAWLDCGQRRCRCSTRTRPPAPRSAAPALPATSSAWSRPPPSGSGRGR